MKGSAFGPFLSIESLFTSLLILAVVVTGMAFSSAQFLKVATLDIQTSRVANAALMVQDEGKTIRADLSGYNISYAPGERVLTMSYSGEKSNRSTAIMESSYSNIVAPTTSTKIDSYLCISNQNNELYITVDRCPT